MLRSLEAQEHAELLREIASKETKIEALEMIKGEKGDIGEDGHTPTSEELLELIEPLIPDPIPGEKGEKGDSIVGPRGPAGKDGRDGLEGIRGKDGSPDTPKQIADKLNTLTEALDVSVFRGYKTTQDIIDEIKKGKLLELRDIKGARLDRASGGFNMNDQRWHGGGGGSVTSIATAGLISGGPITTTGTITTSMNTNRLVGRGTAGVGIMEEITIGSGLSLTGTTLSATGTVITFQTNGTPNGSQTLLNLSDIGTPITLSDNGTGTVTIGIDTADAVTTGALTSTDWNTFNNKVDSVTGVAGEINTTGTTSVTVGLASTAVTPDSYTLTNLTVDSFGRITSASNGTAPTPSLTATQIAFGDGSNLMTSSVSLTWSNGLFVKSQQSAVATAEFHNIGNGTNTNSMRIDLYSAVTTNPDYNTSYMYTIMDGTSVSDGRLTFGTENVDALHIKYGKVGIGTINPAALLNIEGTTQQLRMAYSSTVGLNVTMNSVGSTVWDIVGGTSPYHAFNSPIMSPYEIEPHTTTPIALNGTTDMSDRLHTNEGAGAQVEFTLLSAQQGYRYKFYVQNTNGIRITTAAGDTISVGGVVSATGGYAESFLQGAVLEIACINGTEWVAINSQLSWTVI